MNTEMLESVRAALNRLLDETEQFPDWDNLDHHNGTVEGIKAAIFVFEAEVLMGDSK